MTTRRFGRTGVDIPVIGLGTWHTFDVRGPEIELTRHDVASAAFDAGMRLFDSSPMYGEAERVLGDALRSYRADCFVATKIWTKNGSLDAEKQIEDGLRFFGGSIDLLQVHNLNDTPYVLRRIDELRDEGKVSFAGITHWEPQHFPEMMRIMRTGRVDAIQIPYNVRQQDAAEAILPLAADLDIGVIVMEPLGTGSLSKLPVPSSEIEVFRDFGCGSWAEVLLKWILSDERVQVVIPATSSIEHAQQDARAGDGRLFDEEHRSRVERLMKHYS